MNHQPENPAKKTTFTTDLEVRGFKPTDKDQWFTYEKGLRLLVKPNGGKFWRYAYRHFGKQKTMALGTYPAVSLKQASALAHDARKLLDQNVDPSSQLTAKAKKNAAISLTAIEEKEAANQFSQVAADWFEYDRGPWTPGHAARVWKRLSDNSFSTLGKLSLSAITTKLIIQTLKEIEARGALEVATRVQCDIGRVFRYAIQHELITYNPCSDLKGVIKRSKVKHRASLPKAELPAFLSALEGYPSTGGRKITQLAIKLLLHTFVRSLELREAKWSEFELEAALWRIPGARMKMKTEHLVPLSRQTLAILDELRPITGQYELLFPSERSRLDAMSDNTMRKAIFTLGWDGNTPGKSKAVPHGFRATACSILNESNFNPDAIERQLAPVERNGVRAAYIHHARYLEERTTMMQWWSDFLDQQALSLSSQKLD